MTTPDLKIELLALYDAAQSIVLAGDAMVAMIERLARWETPAGGDNGQGERPATSEPTSGEATTSSAIGPLEQAARDLGYGTDGLQASAAAPASSASGDVPLPPIEALEEYDAEQLVAFRAEHRANPHEPAGCAYCVVLERRLGSL
jgi:hypothetical protein